MADMKTGGPTARKAARTTLGANQPAASDKASGGSLTPKVQDVQPRSLLAAALEYARLGWGVFPVVAKGKKPAGLLVRNGLRDATRDPKQIEAWWLAYPTANIGAVPPEGCFVLDVDLYKDEARLRPLVDRLASLHTPLQRSGGGGLHFVLRGEPPSQAALQKLYGPGVDVKAHGKGYVLAAPSVHPDTGAFYQWGKAPDIAPADKPEWLLEGVAPAAPGVPERDDVGWAHRTNIPLADVVRALSLLDANCSRVQWRDFGQAMKLEYGEEGWEAWHAWSATGSAKYPGERDCRDQWDSFGKNAATAPLGKLVTARNILHAARQVLDGVPHTAPQDWWQEGQIGDMLDTPAPPQRWLWRDLLPCGKVALLAASGGSGKSFLMVQAGLNYAAGRAWGPFVPAPDVPRGEVMLCFSEEDRDDLHRRLQSVVACSGFSEAERAEIPKWLHMRSMRGRRLVLATRGKDGRIEVGPGMLELRAAVEARPTARLVVLDPFVLLHELEENDNAAIAALLSQLDALCLDTGVTILLIHHFNKGKTRAAELTEASVRGASSLVQEVRIVWLMHRLQAEEAGEWGVPAEDHARWVLWTIAKSNNGPWGMRHWFEKRPDGALVLPAAQLVHRSATAVRGEERATRTEDDARMLVQWLARQKVAPGKRAVIEGLAPHLSKQRVAAALAFASNPTLGWVSCKKGQPGTADAYRATDAGIAATG